MSLKKELVRLAKENVEVRPHVLNLLRTASSGYDHPPVMQSDIPLSFKTDIKLFQRDENTSRGLVSRLVVQIRGAGESAWVRESLPFDPSVGNSEALRKNFVAKYYTPLLKGASMTQLIQLGFQVYR